MQVHITELPPFMFFTMFGEESGAVPNYYVRHLPVRIGAIRVEEEKEPAGFLIFSRDTGVYEVKYLYIRPGKRGKGVAGAALAEWEKWIGGERFRVRLPESLEYFEQMRCLVQKQGYRQTDVLHIFRCDRGNVERWEQYMERRGNRMAAYLLENGYTFLPYKEASESVLQELRASRYSEFGNTMDPIPLMDGQMGVLSPEISCLALKNGRLAAYSLVLVGDAQSLIFEQIAAGVPYRREGAFFLAFVGSMQAFIQSSFQRTAYAMYETNSNALAMAERLFKKVTDIEKKQYHFEKECDVAI